MATAFAPGASPSAIDPNALAFRAFADALPHLVFVSGPDGTNRFVNRRFREYTGLSDSALKACGAFEAIHPDDRAAAVAAWERAVARHGVYEVEYRLRAADGAYRWHLTRTVPLVGEHGDPTAWIGSCTDIDDRVRTAEALRAREAQLRLGAELVGLGGYELDWPHGGVRWTSETYRIHGVPEGETIDFARIRALTHPDDRAGNRQVLDRLAQGETTPRIEYRIHRADDGAERWVETRVHATPDGAGGFRVVGVTQDVTDRRAGEAAMRAREELFREMADNAPVMVWVTDPNGHCTFLSRSWYAFTGQTAETALGLGWLDAVHADDAERSARVFLEANAARAPFRLEYRLRRADGIYRWAIDAAAPRFDRDGTYRGYIGSAIDITERKEAELAIAASEEMLRLAQRASGVGTFDWNLDTDTLVWSQECKAVFGLPADAPITYRAFQDLLTIEDRVRVDEAVTAARDPAGSGEYAIEYRVHAPSGEARWIDARGRVLFDGEGDERRANRFLGTVLDITERKRAEAKLAAALEERDLLLSEVNHRVKNSLQVVNALLSLQAGRLPDGEARRALGEAQARVGVVGSIHQRLYMSGRQGRIDMASDGRVMIADVLRAAGGDAGPSLDFACPPGVTLTLTQGVPLFLILNELVTNAVKYAWRDGRRGSIHVGVSRDADWMRVVVADDGDGFAAPTSETGGGLGLKIVNALTRQLRGRLEQPAVALGTSFALSFPLEAADQMLG